MVGAFVTAMSVQLGYPVQGWVAIEEPEFIVIGASGDRYRCDKETKYTEVDKPPVMPSTVRTILDKYNDVHSKEILT